MYLSIFIFFFLSPFLVAEEFHEEKEWGFGMVIRTASIPVQSQKTKLSSITPLFFYEDKYFFLNGLEGGPKLYEDDTWRLSLLARVRFVNVDKTYRDIIQGDTGDFGFQARYKIRPKQNIDLELMRDPQYYRHMNLTYSAELEQGPWQAEPYFTLRYKDADFNRHYYAIERDDIKAGLDAAAGIHLKYHVNSNFYLLGSAQSRWLDKNARHASLVDDTHEDEISLGIGFFNDKSKAKKKIKTSPYLRIAHGWATSSGISEIFTGRNEMDHYNNQLSSVFYGHPLSNELFGFPLDLYLTPGFVWHHSSLVQESTKEYVVAFKGYYTFSLPVQFRLGLAEGLSYIQEVTYIERTELELKGRDYTPSKLLNYLDFSFDVHLGDLFGKTYENYWLGYSIHHRSGIFEKASQFKRIRGGSNYHSLYLQWHF